ncbi:hypothetical protein QJS10_CPA05g02388 [Acorus calamus]|uniref:Protein ENHANCED DISEASE RESISTANCE 2 C-terminal domain-containing protein n=1 Tax=Acorus calamus TaxID=4465 RepID=A0AAV9EXI8_ACOCL|nr:hypothetical protein QJS10_CPA05g02388 [Acorus calamus]
MCPTNQRSVKTLPESETPNDDGDWRRDAINGGSLKHVDLHDGINGWASPPGDLFHLRGPNFFFKRQKSPSGDWLLKPAGVDWLRSASKLDDVLGRPDNRIMSALKRSHSLGRSMKAFIFAVNLQIPGRESHSAVFYFAADDPIPPGSLFYRFVHGDDAFRNERFKIVNRIVKGPWIVKAAVGNYAACLLGKALTCHYHRGENYLEIDVDIGSSAIANAILHLALGYVTAVTIDMGFLVEAKTEEELPERLMGAVRVAQMEMSSATFVDVKVEGEERVAAESGGGGGSKGGKSGRRRVNHHHGRHTAVAGRSGSGGGEENKG